MNIKYLVIVNNAEHSGFTPKVDFDTSWSNENPYRWTYQDITGPYGTVMNECDTISEAQELLNKYLECDAKEKDRYCYTHNPK